MFDNIRNMGNIMKLAGQAREKAEQMQAELERETVTGEAGAGAVRVTLNGKGRAQRIDLDPAMLSDLAGDDKEMAEDLIAAAFNAAMEKVQNLVMEKTRELTGGMDLPGMENLLGGQ